jgi:hypothetical protein
MKLLDAWKKESGVQELTPESLRALIIEVNSDPLAGLGSLSKMDILVDRIMAQWRICSAQIRGIPVKDARPLIVGKVETTGPIAEKAAAATKAAGG